MSIDPSGVDSPSSRCRRSASQAPPVRMPTMPVALPTWPLIWRTSASQRLLRRGRAVALVGERHGHAIARAELPREAPDARRERVLGALGRDRHAEKELARTPFAHERIDVREPGTRARDAADRMG